MRNIVPHGMGGFPSNVATFAECVLAFHLSPGKKITARSIVSSGYKLVIAVFTISAMT